MKKNRTNPELAKKADFSKTPLAHVPVADLSKLPPADEAELQHVINGVERAIEVLNEKKASAELAPRAVPNPRHSLKRQGSYP